MSDNQGCGVLCGGYYAGANKKGGRDEGCNSGGDLGGEVTGHDEVLWGLEPVA
ncbi:hypothetical protein [Sphingorhabdus sp. Alg231-15]|uniref:hypothetical protein n=1 Tax=Sphingorhabdus sp. Alg231-15 TaxID=1922222 RepID=UPI00307C6A6D